MFYEHKSFIKGKIRKLKKKYIILLDIFLLQKWFNITTVGKRYSFR